MHDRVPLDQSPFVAMTNDALVAIVAAGVAGSRQFFDGTVDSYLSEIIQ
jgi:hypothetical protein